jgi:hypothetical protein
MAGARPYLEFVRRASGRLGQHVPRNPPVQDARSVAAQLEIEI